MFQEQWPRLETNRDQGLSRLPQSAERYQLLTQLLAQRAARRTGPEMSVQGLPAFRGPWLSREAPQAAR